MKLLNCFLLFCDERMIFTGGGYCLIWVIRVRAAGTCCALREVERVCDSPADKRCVCFPDLHNID